MRRPFMIVFGVTTLLGAASYVALRSLLAGGGTAAAALLVVLVLPTAAGLALLIRVAYLDGIAQRGEVARARELRRRL